MQYIHILSSSDKGLFYFYYFLYFYFFLNGELQTECKNDSIMHTPNAHHKVNDNKQISIPSWNHVSYLADTNIFCYIANTAFVENSVFGPFLILQEIHICAYLHFAPVTDQITEQQTVSMTIHTA